VDWGSASIDMALLTELSWSVIPLSCLPAPTNAPQRMLSRKIGRREAAASSNRWHPPCDRLPRTAPVALGCQAKKAQPVKAAPDGGWGRLLAPAVNRQGGSAQTEEGTGGRLRSD
jgi:hypothetical protein